MALDTVTPTFPSEQFCRSVVRFLDALEYEDDNLTLDERVQGLRYVHSKTAEYFTQALPRETLKRVHPERIAAVTRTISHFIIYCWSRVPRDVQVEISIYLSIINVLDDEINADPNEQMGSFWVDLLQGKQQKHPFWLLMNARLPTLLSHYGSFCSFNIMRCTFDYFEGCWIEQHNFRGYPGSDRYPDFLRRLNCLGGAVGGTMFPAVDFDDQKLFREFACVMAQIDGPVALMNDLFSFYKEFNLDEANLVSNWCAVDGISLDQALERLTDETIHACQQILSVFKDKDPSVLATIRTFIRGYVTWHFCDLRYRLREVYDAAKDHGPVGAKFRQYFEKALDVGWVDLDQWTLTPPENHLSLNGAEVDIDPAQELNPAQVNGAEISEAPAAHEAIAVGG
ncbi:trichodiene synthase (TRI5) [Capronia epimyces CBS 606.96]|uniref:Trichodiene synthase n=1 Tax=Capronia epimyces CBS 606.96 TaxID=1182542 RepID=W9YAX9_9EURO|nr:trichodiene synthase (TRI5) [Capronia epimyces CBS 606.96]EXJ89683.1 trichodiene synthase (TRI5) [Capronia epimyces CBS 606.96]